MDAVH